MCYLEFGYRHRRDDVPGRPVRPGRGLPALGARVCRLCAAGQARFVPGFGETPAAPAAGLAPVAQVRSPRGHLLPAGDARIGRPTSSMSDPLTPDAISPASLPPWDLRS